MKTYSVYGFPPPKPKRYPETILVHNHYGLSSFTIKNDKEYHGLAFWFWGCRPAGHSINSPLQRDVDGGDLQVKGQT